MTIHLLLPSCRRTQVGIYAAVHPSLMPYHPCSGGSNTGAQNQSTRFSFKHFNHLTIIIIDPETRKAGEAYSQIFDRQISPCLSYLCTIFQSVQTVRTIILRILENTFLKHMIFYHSKKHRPHQVLQNAALLETAAACPLLLNVIQYPKAIKTKMTCAFLHASWCAAVICSIKSSQEQPSFQKKDCRHLRDPQWCHFIPERNGRPFCHRARRHFLIDLEKKACKYTILSNIYNTLLYNN